MAAPDPVIRPLQDPPQEYAAAFDTNSPRLLEVRTEAGAIYVCPSGWERIRLEWVFRHFHILPPELLSRGDRLMIERLTHSAAVVTEQRVPRSAVFGVVERASREAARGPVPVAAVGLPGSASSSRARRQPREGFAAVRELANWMIHRPARPRAQQWKGLAMLGIACLAIILVKKHDGPPAPPRVIASPPPSSPVPAGSASLQDLVDRGDAAGSRGHVELPLAAAPPANVAPARPLSAEPQNQLELMRSGAAASPPASELVLSSSTKTPSGASSDLQTAPAVAASAPAAPDILPEGGEPEAPTAQSPVTDDSSVTAESSATASRPFVSELPESGFGTPTLSRSDFMGTVKLHMVIGTDGSVRDIHVLSGDSRAAQAAIAAVKGWRYAPQEVDGHAVEAETRVGISFFGRDAVSVRPLP